jgi:NAD(P)-dependent dehydrogenase (short-subunit alcohol dehydrogenase family)
MFSQSSDVWFITGCSTGFGRELAKLLIQRGYRTVVTARELHKIEDITVGHQGQALALKLDVTSHEDVAASVRQAESAFGRVDVLVNNAGYGYLGTVEESGESEARAMFETNFFGLARMTRAVLPGMRSRRRGCIVNISSIGGLVGFPGVGYYNATKFAVEGLSEALQKELQPMGIKVLVVEPGPFRTDWAGRSMKISERAISDYADTAWSNVDRISKGSGKQIGDPVRASEAIIKAVESDNTPLHLVLGKMAVQTARTKLDQLKQEIDSWEETSLGADFPQD